MTRLHPLLRFPLGTLVSSRVVNLLLSVAYYSPPVTSRVPPTGLPVPRLFVGLWGHDV